MGLPLKNVGTLRWWIQHGHPDPEKKVGWERGGQLASKNKL